MFYQVVRAKKKDTANVYALKIMDKKFITKENKTAYVKLERIVLDQLDHPGVVRLFFTFQDTFSLCEYFIHSSFSVFPPILHALLLIFGLSNLIVFVCIMKTWHLSLVKVESFLIK